METISTDFQKPIYQPYPKAKKNELHKYIKKKKKKKSSYYQSLFWPQCEFSDLQERASQQYEQNVNLFFLNHVGTFFLT